MREQDLTHSHNHEKDDH